MATNVPLNCPAFQSEARKQKPTEGPASVSGVQSASLAVLAIFAWALVLAPLLIGS